MAVACLFLYIIEFQFVYVAADESGLTAPVVYSLYSLGLRSDQPMD